MTINGDGGYSLLACYVDRPVAQANKLALSISWRLLGAMLYSSREPSELLQWFCHDDSTINSAVVIIITIFIIIIIIHNHEQQYHQQSSDSHQTLTTLSVCRQLAVAITPTEEKLTVTETVTKK